MQLVIPSIIDANNNDAGFFFFLEIEVATGSSLCLYTSLVEPERPCFVSCIFGARYYSVYIAQHLGTKK